MTGQVKNASVVQEQKLAAHYAVHFANRALVEHDWSEQSYIDGRAALDDTMLLLSEAKWLQGRAVGNYAGFIEEAGSDEDLQAAGALYCKVKARADQITGFLHGEPLPAFEPDGPLEKRWETLFYRGVPIVPTICPLVLLKGSNFDMGRQYAQQVLDIYGPFIFTWHARRPLDADSQAQIARWEAELARDMPEILEFARGWAEGATGCGVEMDYIHALAIWTGVKPPVENLTALGGLAGMGAPSAPPADPLRPGEVPDMCSGAAAWGDGTTDGNLVVGATTDHDCTFQAAIVAFPDRGNNFIYTPFSANGSLPVLGHFFMAGHPGMNNKGLSYIHHGGSICGEPAEQWGYGVRRGPYTIHLLQFAETTQDVVRFSINLSVGDSGTILGYPGGLWATSSAGVSIEGRPGAPDPAAKPILRELTFGRDGKGYQFLYANNNAISPDSGHMNGAPPEGYRWELEAGWFTTDPALINSGPNFRRLTKDSAGRNRYAHRILLAGYGKIDVPYMTMKYRQSGTVPEGDFDEVSARYHAGEEWNISTAHRTNALTVIARPRHGSDGIYRACVGPANRAVACRDPGHGYYYYDETNAFWEITLADEPREVVRIAAALAETNLNDSTRRWSTLEESFAGRDWLRNYLADARLKIADGHTLLEACRSSSGDHYLRTLAKALRRFTHAQVRANQVLEAIDKPADRAEMLQLRETA